MDLAAAATLSSLPRTRPGVDGGERGRTRRFLDRLAPALLEVWADKVPFVVLLVELGEGVRMLGQLVDADGTLLQTEAADGLGMGRTVGLRWRTDESGQNLPAWLLA